MKLINSLIKKIENREPSAVIEYILALDAARTRASDILDIINKLEKYEDRLCLLSDLLPIADLIGKLSKTKLRLEEDIKITLEIENDLRNSDL